MWESYSMFLKHHSVILFFFNTCLFIFGCVWFLLLHLEFLYLRRVGATLCCGVWVCHCSGLSCCGAWDLGMQASATVACRLQITGSVVVAHRPSCSMACGIEPLSPAWAGGFLTTAPPEMPHLVISPKSDLTFSLVKW